MVIFVTMFTMLLNEVIADKLEALRKERRIGVYTLCNRAAVSYETYRGIRKKRTRIFTCARCSSCSRRWASRLRSFFPIPCSRARNSISISGDGGKSFYEKSGKGGKIFDKRVKKW